MKTIQILLLTLFLAVSLSQSAGAQGTTCPGALASQLIVGAQARVTPGSANNVRSQPSASAERIGRIEAGTVVNVLQGPTCADNLAWWEVQTTDGTLTGWTIESFDGSYALLPYEDRDDTLTIPAGYLAVNSDGVRFLIPEEVAGGMVAGREDGLLPSEVFPGDAWAASPAAMRFIFAPDASEASFDNRIIVYPARAYMRLNPNIAEQLLTLQDILAARPTPSDETLAQLNFVGFMAQAFAADGQYIQTDAVVGVRYLTFFSQEAIPVVRDAVRYVFYGLTTDGEYFIDAQLRLQVDALPSSLSEIPSDVWTVQTGVIDPAYYDDLVAQLESLPSDQFTPRLETLDAIIASLQISDDTLQDYIAAADVEGDQRVAVPDLAYTACDDSNLPSRLTLGGAARVVDALVDDYIPAVTIPGGQASGVMGLPYADNEPVRVLHGPVCVGDITWWLLFAGTSAGWFQEMAPDSVTGDMEYQFEPVEPIPAALPTPPDLQGQQVADCRLIVSGTSIAFSSPRIGESAGQLFPGGTYYADALRRRPEGGYLFWRLTPGAPTRGGEPIPDVAWVLSDSVTPAPECADVPVVERPEE